MIVTKNEIDALNATLTVELTAADYAEAVEKSLKDYQKKAAIKGFRPGKVPFGLIKKMYGPSVKADELNRQLQKALSDYIKENDLHLMGEPLPSETQEEIDFEKEDLSFVYDVAFAPEMIISMSKKEKLPFYIIEVTDKMIDEQIESYRRNFGTRVEEEKKEGATEDEKKEPEVQLAEVNQELFDKVYGPDKVHSEEEFREMVKSDISKQFVSTSEYRFTIDAREKMLKKNAEVELPDAFLKRWMLATNEKMTQEEVEKDYIQYKDEFKWQMIKSQLAKAHELKVTDDNVKAEARAVAASQLQQYGLFGLSDEQLDGFAEHLLKDKKQVNDLYERALDNLIFAVIREGVKVEDTPISTEKFQALFK